MTVMLLSTIASPAIMGLMEMPSGAERARRDGQHQAVVEKRPKQILLDIADGLFADGEQFRDLSKIFVHQNDVRSVHR